MLKNEDRLRELGFFRLVKRSLKGGLTTMFQCLKGIYKEDGDSPFTKSHMAEAGVKVYKLFLGRF